MKRHQTKSFMIGNVPIGSDHPVTIQSMTTTKTKNAEDTIQQILRLENAGCEIVRVAIPDMESAQAVAEIKRNIHIPLVADIHFDYRLALKCMENGIDKIRINPGNIGSAERVREVARMAKEKHIPIRIGVNSGSLEKDLLEKYQKPCAQAVVESAARHIDLLRNNDFEDIVVSLKTSDVRQTIESYQLFAQQFDYPLHIGITESGTVGGGIVKSSVGIGILLHLGLGDTLRVSLTGDPVNEVITAKRILKSLGLRKTGAEIVSCPTCGRCNVSLEPIALAIEEALQSVQTPIKVAVMGCAVNGPGEAKDADFGVACGDGVGLIFTKGEILKKVPEREIIPTLLEFIHNAEQ